MKLTPTAYNGLQFDTALQKRAKIIPTPAPWSSLSFSRFFPSRAYTTACPCREQLHTNQRTRLGGAHEIGKHLEPPVGHVLLPEIFGRELHCVRRAHVPLHQPRAVAPAGVLQERHALHAQLVAQPQQVHHVVLHLRAGPAFLGHAKGDLVVAGFRGRRSWRDGVSRDGTSSGRWQQATATASGENAQGKPHRPPAGGF